jgi:hypothetical protein
MVQGAVRMNDASLVTDSAANKTCELYVACLALGCGWSVSLDDPEKSSAGLNPDVIIDRNGSKWSVAAKTIHGVPSQTIFDNIKSAIRQIERAKESGIAFINLKNRVDHAQLLPTGAVYASVMNANHALDGIMRDVINKLRAEITDEDWLEAFRGKLARPVVAFMAQSLASAHISSDEDSRINTGEIFVPIRMIMALPVPPLSRDPSLTSLDLEAWNLLGELNRELQATPPPALSE